MLQINLERYDLGLGGLFGTQNTELGISLQDCNVQFKFFNTNRCLRKRTYWICAAPSMGLVYVAGILYVINNLLGYLIVSDSVSKICQN
jgi:hypothetical protein